MDAEELVFEGRSSEYSRKVWLARGPADARHPLCVFLDAEYYFHKMGALGIVKGLCDAGRIPRMTCVFVSHVDAATRHADFVCNERYGRYIAEDLVDWAKEQAPAIRGGRHVICGLSLRGLMSAYLALNYQQVFSYSLCQSGSFWWRHEWFGQMARAAAPITTRFWLSVGDQETDTNVAHPPTGLFQEICQISGIDKAASVLKEIGGEVRVNKYRGGHAPGFWRHELGQALVWLLQDDGAT